MSVLIAAASMALALAASGWAWTQSYVFVERFSPNHTGSSIFQQSLVQNYINWDNRYGGYPSVGLRYCRSDGSCYEYAWTQTPGVLYDYRTVSYGRAQCHAYLYNNYDVWVTECRVWNAY